MGLKEYTWYRWRLPTQRLWETAHQCLKEELTFIVCFLLSLLFFLSTLPIFNGNIEYPGGHIPMIIKDDGTNNDGVTIVSAYFNIGSYVKGSIFSDSVTPETYMEWANTFKYLKNPLVFFTDYPQMFDKFVDIRRQLHQQTKIIKIDQNYIWGFHLQNRINLIYAAKDYPKFHPNTVLPKYSCSQHAKYSCLERSIQNNYFDTKYMAWLDLGYFRHLVNRQKYFRISLPPDFNSSQVALNLVFDSSLEKEPENVFLENDVRNGGGFVLGEKTVLLDFIAHYKWTTEYFVQLGLSNTDQQVLYAMFCQKQVHHYPPPVLIQEYSAISQRGNKWFYLGYLCYREIT